MNGNTNKKPVAIVTGASSGIGLGITRALLEHGYRVVANSRTISKSKDLKPSVDLLLVDGDIGKKETAIKVVDAAVRHFDRIDLLVNCAGIYIPKPFTEYTPEDFETMISTNIAGYFFVTQQVVVQMRKQKVRPHREHIDGFGRSAIGRRAHRTARHHQVHHSGVQPRLGNGIRGRRDSIQYDLTRCR